MHAEILPDVDLSPLSPFALDLDQYFGLWAVEPDRFLPILERVSQMNLAAHVEIHQDAREREATARAAAASQKSTSDDATIQIIDLSGTLTKRGKSLSSSRSLVRLRQSVRQAARDPEIGGILLRIDSPGGTVAGTADLANEVARAAAMKPTWAFAEDLTASAAYWVASQAEQIFANDATALVGSIGTFIGMYDQSAKAEKKGIKPVVIATGRYKGAGFSGTPITDEQKAYWQNIVDQTQAEFSGGVARGRKLDPARVAELADGRVHVAAAAKSMGLIDGIQTFEQTLAALGEAVRRRKPAAKQSTVSTSTKESPKMSETSTAPAAAAVPPAPTAASFADLKAGLPGASADFICAQLDKSATLGQAQQAWMAEQNRQLEAARKDTDAAKAAAAAKVPGKGPGVELLGDGKEGAAKTAEGGDPVAQWNTALEAMVQRHKGNRQRAVSALVKAQPELHTAYLAAANSGRAKA